jgi:hypothetical protein
MPAQSIEFTNETWLGLEKRILQVFYELSKMMLGNSTECNINWKIQEKS